MFWLEKPSAFFENAAIVPNRQMDDDEVLNSISRMIVIVCIVLCIFSLVLGLIVIVLGLLMVVLCWYVTSKTSNIRAVGNFTCERKRRKRRNICEKCSQKESEPVPPKVRKILPRY